MNEYENFIIPKYVYVPFDDKKDIILKNDSYVFCSNKLTTFNNKSIFSTVSGNAIGLKKVNSEYGLISTVVIENDFKEKKEKFVYVRKNISKLSKEEIDCLLKENNIDISKFINEIVLNIEYKKGVLENDQFYLKENILDVLETLDILSSAYSLNIYILLNDKDLVSNTTLINFLGTYPNFKVINKLKIKKDINIIGVKDILDIYSILKNKKTYLKNILVTVNYKKITKVIKIKVYSNLIELISYLNLSPKKVRITTSNNILDLTSFDFVLTSNITSIIFMV